MAATTAPTTTLYTVCDSLHIDTAGRRHCRACGEQFPDQLTTEEIVARCTDILTEVATVVASIDWTTVDDALTAIEDATHLCVGHIGETITIDTDRDGAVWARAYAYDDDADADVLVVDEEIELWRP